MPNMPITLKSACTLTLLALSLCCTTSASGQTSAANPEPSKATNEGKAESNSAVAKFFRSMDRAKVHRTAIEKGLAVLRRGVDNYPNHRQCFSCHHQAIPLLAFSLATKREQKSWYSPLDTERVAGILQLTKTSFTKQADALRMGLSIDGKALTVGYGLWTLQMAGEPKGELTDAMIENLVRTQREDGRWTIDSFRPPAASSDWMATALALRGFRYYCTDEQLKEGKVSDAIWKALLWTLQSDEPTTTEDWVGAAWCAYLLSDIDRKLNPPTFGYGGSGLKRQDVQSNSFRVWLDIHSGLSQDEIAVVLKRRVTKNIGARTPWDFHKKLKSLQNADGGWGQKAGMDSDAYSTGSALVMLSQREIDYEKYDGPSQLGTGTQIIVSKGVQYLLKTQCEDGSWHVVSRAKPVQEFFDNGDPHGSDQFISTLATGWATAALLSAWFEQANVLESR